MPSNITAIVISIIFVIVGVVLLAISAYLTGKDSKKDMAPGLAFGCLLILGSLAVAISASTSFYSHPDIPVGVKMKVVASYVSVDGQTMHILQWQEGEEKLDHEITVDAKRLHTDQPPLVDNELIMLDNDKAIVLPYENQP